jgi:hypothetical protein
MTRHFMSPRMKAAFPSAALRARASMTSSLRELAEASDCVPGKEGAGRDAHQDVSSRIHVWMLPRRAPGRASVAGPTGWPAKNALFPRFIQ